MEFITGELNMEESRAIIASMIDTDASEITGFVIVAVSGDTAKASLMTCCSAEHALAIMGQAIHGIAVGLGKENGLYELVHSSRQAPASSPPVWAWLMGKLINAAGASNWTAYRPPPRVSRPHHRARNVAWLVKRLAR